VHTLQPVLKRGRCHWDKINLPEIEFLERVSRLKKIMAEHNINALLLYGNGVSNYGYQCYVSNFIPESVGGVLVIIPAAGDVSLIFEGVARSLPTVKSLTWIKDIRATDNIARGCVEYLESIYPATSTLGIVGLQQLMPFAQWHYFIEHSKKYTVKDANTILRNLIAVKSSRETDQIRRASRIIRRALDNLSGIKYPEINERLIEAEAEKFCYAEGAEDVRVLFAYPEGDAQYFKPAETRPFSGSMSTSVYLAAAFETYWAEGIRTYKIRTPYIVSQENPEAFRTVLNYMKNGVPISSFFRKTTDALLKSGSSLYMYPGNSIGLGLQESPFIQKDEKTRLKTGMCFTVRVVTFDNKIGKTVTGNTIILTKNGPEIIT